MPQIMTACWFTKLPAGAAPVGISRGVPRGKKAGYHRLRELEPGPWFKSVSPKQYLERYQRILDCLDPSAIRDQLLAYGDAPVMLCCEAAHDCHAGGKWCHHHLAAQWLEDRLDIEVHEVGFPNLNRFAYLRNLGIPLPNYRTSALALPKKQWLR
jgi:hypothetical protein